jgi:hypothetical protein
MFIRFDVSVKDKIIISDKLICSIIFNKDFEIGGKQKGRGTVHGCMERVIFGL